MKDYITFALIISILLAKKMESIYVCGWFIDCGIKQKKNIINIGDLHSIGGYYIYGLLVNILLGFFGRYNMVFDEVNFGYFFGKLLKDFIKKVDYEFIKSFNLIAAWRFYSEKEITLCEEKTVDCDFEEIECEFA